jgi:hypothetical protein
MDLPRLALLRASLARPWDTELLKVLVAMAEVNRAPLPNGLSLSPASRTSTTDSAVISSSRGQRGPLGLHQGRSYNLATALRNSGLSKAHSPLFCFGSFSSFFSRFLSMLYPGFVYSRIFHQARFSSLQPFLFTTQRFPLLLSRDC